MLRMRPPSVQERLYDSEFEDDLRDAIARAIVLETPVSGAQASPETITALGINLAAAIALTPGIDRPAVARRTVQQIADFTKLGLLKARERAQGTRQ